MLGPRASLEAYYDPPGIYWGESYNQTRRADGAQWLWTAEDLLRVVLAVLEVAHRSPSPGARQIRRPAGKS